MKLKKIIVLNKEMNIGIVLNYKNAEKKKDELLSIESKPWLKLADQSKYSSFIVKKKEQKFVPADVAIGLYIENKFPDIKIDYITPD